LLANRRLANLLGFTACVSMLGYALYAQYVLLLDPCPLCLFQRFAVMGLGVVFLLAALHSPKRGGAKVYASLLIFLALTGIAIAAWHLRIQNLPPGSVPSCGASLGYLFEIMSVFDLIKKVFSGSGECAKVDVMLGLSWPWWIVISMTVLGAWAWLINWKLAAKRR
jgi:protein dithiol:quinone oxidoreductase